jgi:putative DNA primase/helicase
LCAGRSGRRAWSDSVMTDREDREQPDRDDGADRPIEYPDEYELPPGWNPEADHGGNGASHEPLETDEAEINLTVPDYVLTASDEANGIRLLQNFGMQLKHCDELGWLAWEGRYWEGQTKTAPRVVQCLTRIGHALVIRAKILYEQPDKADDKKDTKRLEQVAASYMAAGQRCQNAGWVRGILSYTSTLEGITCKPTLFDQDPWILNVANGCIDLRTCELRRHCQLDYITKIVEVAYDPAAKCPRWEKFLCEIFVLSDGAPDLSLVHWLQKWFGYCLTGSNDEQCLVIFWGAGANGKSTMLETLRWILAAYAANTPTDTLLETHGSRGPENDVARLRGVRLLTAIETKEDRKLDQQRAKQMTGKDRLTARFLFKEHFEFTFTAKINLAVNHRPQIDGVDHAIWRRIRLVPMTRQFAEHEKIKDLDELLKQEASGILGWLVEGARRWKREGLDALPTTIEQGTKDYRHESNSVARFVDECCVTGPAFACKMSVLAARYNAFAKAVGRPELRANELGKRLAALDFGAEKRGAEKHTWALGLMLDGSDREAAQ